MCFVKVFLIRKVWLHSGHLWGFSPVAGTRENGEEMDALVVDRQVVVAPEALATFFTLVRLLPCNKHGWSYSTGWKRLANRDLKCSSQKEHLKGRSWVCRIMCSCSHREVLPAIGPEVRVVLHQNSRGSHLLTCLARVFLLAWSLLQKGHLCSFFWKGASLACFFLWTVRLDLVE
ncbi:hypothetical protein EYF80_035447 [Liparis tanakae]|uniref:Uncharacterized protein n=1 Tax=Liparis tanakae TaxID=230148 RepID=A0A4Z2GLF0_9TELE|nr:hypothetical protein EYF80_035447 [Liparis tanakae]